MAQKHIKGDIEPVNELLALFLGVDLLRLRAHVYHEHMYTVYGSNPPVTDNCPSWVSGREINFMINLYVSYVAGRWLELVTPVSAVRRAGDCVITSCLWNDNEWL